LRSRHGVAHRALPDPASQTRQCSFHIEANRRGHSIYRLASTHPLPLRSPGRSEEVMSRMFGQHSWRKNPTRGRGFELGAEKAAGWGQVTLFPITNPTRTRFEGRTKWLDHSGDPTSVFYPSRRLAMTERVPGRGHVANVWEIRRGRRMWSVAVTRSEALTLQKFEGTADRTLSGRRGKMRRRKGSRRECLGDHS